MQIINDEVTAQDIVQDIFVKVYFALPRFDHKAKLSTWIYQIAYHEAISAKRKFKDMSPLSPDIPDAVNVEYDFEKEERLQHLAAIVNELRPDDRIIIMLYYYEDNSIDDIANIVNLSVANVKVRLHRIRKHIQQQLEQKENNYE